MPEVPIPSWEKVTVGLQQGYGRFLGFRFMALSCFLAPSSDKTGEVLAVTVTGQLRISDKLLAAGFFLTPIGVSVTVSNYMTRQRNLSMGCPGIKPIV